MKAVILRSFNQKPLVEEWPDPVLAPSELRLKMFAAPINPADLNVLEGKYGRLPTLPAIPGNEGVGQVIEVGAAVTGFSVGDWVLPLLSGRGTWAEQMAVPAATAVKLPSDLDPLQAAMWMINPPTAFGLLTQFVILAPGEWIVQNAANSGVGRCVIQIARQLGIRTVNVCRRLELIDELTQLGGDICLTEDTDLRTLSVQAKLALNSVGGMSALNLSGLLAPGGIHVTYGAMARQPLKIPNGPLIFKDLSFRGFWVTRWLETLERPQLQALFDQLAAWGGHSQLIQPLHAVFGLDQIGEALHQSAQEKRSGKVLLKFAD